MSNGPVCHIPPANTPANPQAHNVPGMPPPINPGSKSFNNDVANMLNAFRQMLMTLLGQLNSLNNNTNNGGVSNGFTTKQGDKGNNYTQVSQATEKVRVYQNNDPTTGNYVEVERTNRLVMKDKQGNTWVWERPPSG